MISQEAAVAVTFFHLRATVDGPGPPESIVGTARCIGERQWHSVAGTGGIARNLRPLSRAPAR